MEQSYRLGVCESQSQPEEFFVGYPQVVGEHRLELAGAALGQHGRLLERLFWQTGHTLLAADLALGLYYLIRLPGRVIDKGSLVEEEQRVLVNEALQPLLHDQVHR